MDNRIFLAEQSDSGQRLDKFLTVRMPDFSRSRIQQIIEQSLVLIADKPILDSAYKVKAGEQYIVGLLPPINSEIISNDTKLNVIFEDEHLLVINKPAGMTVHPAPGHTSDTLVNALLGHCGDSLSGIGGVMRPGIVHRIDKDTSGLLVVAKHDIAHRHLSEQLALRTLKRTYTAIVKGMPVPTSGTIDAAIGRSPRNRQKMAVLKSGGKDAVTHYRTNEIFADATWLTCNLETGRTHQIRVHLSHIGHPIVGDQVYGRKFKNIDFPRQALHAQALTLIHPISGEKMDFECDLPQDMLDLIEMLRG